MAISCLCQQLQLFGRYRFIRLFAGSGVWAGFQEESLYKWESYMPDLCRMNECRICCPIEPCDRPCDEAGVKWTVGRSVPDRNVLNHPLDLDGVRATPGKMDGNSYFSKHLDQSGMSRWMQFGISEYGEPGRNFMDIQLRTVRKRDGHRSACTQLEVLERFGGQSIARRQLALEGGRNRVGLHQVFEERKGGRR